MLRGFLLALPIVGVSATALAPSHSITAPSPFEIMADGFRSLRGIAVDEDDRVFVADREAGTVTRIEDGRWWVIARHLARPVGVALDAHGRVLVAEERAGRVVRLDPSGPTPIVKGIKQPRWLAVSESGTVYISARRLTRNTDPEPDDESAEPETILALAGDGTLSVFADGFERLQGLAARTGAVYAATTGLRGSRGDDGVLYRIPVLPDGRAGRIVRHGPRDAFERPAGVAIDRLGAVYVSAPETDLGAHRSKHVVVKLHADQTATVFAADLDHPQGLAFDRHGHLYVADGRAGRVVRFVAPPAPRLLRVPRFTNHPLVALTGLATPNARVDVFVNDVTMPVTAAGGTGAFTVAIAPALNTESRIDAFATAQRGKGLTSPPAEIKVVHDSLAPALVLHSPPAGGFVRGTVEVGAEAADAGSHLATLGVGVAGRAFTAVVAPPLPAPAATATASWSTTGSADGTQTLTATAGDRAGNTVTVSRVVIVDNTAPETEIVSGPDGTTTQPTATFTFTGADNLTPVSGLRFAWRLDSGPLSAFTSDTTVALAGLAPGAHVFEVLARDLAGNEDPTPARRTFTVGALNVSVTITEPIDGAAVTTAGTLLVRGTVDAGGAEVGVGVNGVAALVHGSEWAAVILVAPGANVVTAIAGAISGAEGTASIIVNAAEADSGVYLKADPASGVAPLEVTWRVAGRTPRPLVQFELDRNGDGSFSAPVAVLDGTRSIYPDAGLRFPTVRATDDLGNVYLVKTLVRVDDALTAAARFQAVWSSFTARLQAGDQAGALTHLSPGLRPRFESTFQRLGAALPGIAAGFGSIELIDEVDNIAEAAIIQIEDGTPQLYFIYFRRDNQGRWLIQEM